jgi:hypothetical protein
MIEREREELSPSGSPPPDLGFLRQLPPLRPGLLLWSRRAAAAALSQQSSKVWFPLFPIISFSLLVAACCSWLLAALGCLLLLAACCLVLFMLGAGCWVLT